MSLFTIYLSLLPELRTYVLYRINRLSGSLSRASCLIERQGEIKVEEVEEFLVRIRLRNRQQRRMNNRAKG